MKIGLFVKDELIDSDIPTLIVSKISEYGFTFDQEHPEVVIFVGGDGTFLRAVHTYIEDIDNILFVGINKGSLGFYTDFSLEDIDNILISLSNDEFNLHSFRILEGTINSDKIYAVNEIRIENPFHTLNAKVYIDDEEFETFRGNGLCVCSSLGSSAYNKSLGGSVVLPQLETLQLTEIAPINNRLYNSLGSSLVLSKDSKIMLTGDFEEIVVGYDHLTFSETSDCLLIKLSDKRVNVIYKNTHSFIAHLREAFNND